MRFVKKKQSMNISNMKNQRHRKKKISELNKKKNEIDRNLENIIYKNVNKASLKVFKKINGFKL